MTSHRSILLFASLLSLLLLLLSPTSADASRVHQPKPHKNKLRLQADADGRFCEESSAARMSNSLEWCCPHSDYQLELNPRGNGPQCTQCRHDQIACPDEAGMCCGADASCITSSDGRPMCFKLRDKKLSDKAAMELAAQPRHSSSKQLSPRLPTDWRRDRTPTPTNQLSPSTKHRHGHRGGERGEKGGWHGKGERSVWLWVFPILVMVALAVGGMIGLAIWLAEGHVKTCSTDPSGPISYVSRSPKGGVIDQFAGSSKLQSPTNTHKAIVASAAEPAPPSTPPPVPAESIAEVSPDGLRKRTSNSSSVDTSEVFESKEQPAGSEATISPQETDAGWSFEE